MSNQKIGIMTNPANAVKNITAPFGVQQRIKQPTHISNTSSFCIDLIFTSQPNFMADSSVHSLLHPNCHCQIDFAKLNLQFNGSCSVVGKPLCYHCVSNPGLISHRSPSSCFQANSAFHPSEVGKRVPDNTGANSGSSMMRAAPIGHHWWYDRWVSTYDPGSIGRTM